MYIFSNASPLWHVAHANHTQERRAPSPHLQTWVSYMLVILPIISGAAFGAARAKKRGGNGLDMLQYGAVYAIIFGIAGLAITIVAHRMLS